MRSSLRTIGAILLTCLLAGVLVDCSKDSGDQARNSAGQKVAMEVRGERQITSASVADQHPAWSPDGATIAFHSSRAGNFDVWFVPAAGGEPTRLTTSSRDEGFPWWSPDGSRIAFIVFRGEARQGRGDIAVMNADGTNQIILTDDGTMKYGVRWHPSGQSVVYADGDESSGNDRIWELTLETGARRQILSGYGGGVSVGPTARRIAFDSLDPKSQQRCLYVLDDSTKAVTPLVTDMDRPWFPDWSPDGKWIVFHSGKGGSGGIWVISPDGTSRKRLIKSGRYPRWSPDGRKLAFTRGVGEDAHIWVAEIACD